MSNEFPEHVALEAAQQAVTDQQAVVTRLETALVNNEADIEAARAANVAAIVADGRATMKPVPVDHAAEIEEALEQARRTLESRKAAVRRAEQALTDAHARAAREANDRLVAEIGSILDRARSEIDALVQQLPGGEYPLPCGKLVRVEPLAPSTRLVHARKEVYVEGAPGTATIELRFQLEPQPDGTQLRAQLAADRAEMAAAAQERRERNQRELEAAWTRMSTSRQRGVSPTQKL